MRNRSHDVVNRGQAERGEERRIGMSPKSIVLNDGELCGPMRGFVDIAIGSTIRYISFYP